MNTIEEIKKLKSLLDQGAIGEDEFNFLKKQLMSNNENSKAPEKQNVVNPLNTIERKKVESIKPHRDSELNNIQPNNQSKTGDKKNKSKKKNIWKVIIPSLIIIIVSVTYISIAYKSESQRYSELLISRDLLMAYEFQSKYSESTFGIDSLIQEFEYDKVAASEDIHVLKNFVANFPNFRLVESIVSRIAQIEWDKVIKSPNADNISSFMENYPNSPFYQQAESWLFENESEGILIDKRNGRRYNWYKIDNLIWMSIDKTIAGNEINDYDRTRNNELVAKNLCPDGWHIPNLYEWVKSIEYSTGKKYFENSGDFKNNNLLKRLIGDKSYSFIEHDTQKFLTSPISDWSGYGYFSIWKTYEEDMYMFNFGSSIYNGETISIICVKDYENNNVFQSDNNAIDIDGNVYRTIKAKNKTWFYDDLKTTRFSNGDIIPNKDEIYCENDKKNIYQKDAPMSGKFYSGYAVIDSRNVCPSGWHVATTNEWKEVLEDSSAELKFYTNGYISCLSPNLDYYANEAFFWSSDGNYIRLSNIEEIIKAYTEHYNSGYCVRCVKD